MFVLMGVHSNAMPNFRRRTHFLSKKEQQQQQHNNITHERTKIYSSRDIYMKIHYVPFNL